VRTTAAVSLTYYVESITVNPQSICNIIHISINNLLINKEFRVSIIDVSGSPDQQHVVVSRAPEGHIIESGGKLEVVVRAVVAG
jgi:hypothetical protein